MFEYKEKLMKLKFVKRSLSGRVAQYSIIDEKSQYLGRINWNRNSKEYSLHPGVCEFTIDDLGEIIEFMQSETNNRRLKFRVKTSA